MRYSALFLTGLLTALSACQSPSTSSPAVASAPSQTQTLIDFKKGQGSMRLTLHAQEDLGFKTQASANGQVSKSTTEVSNLEIFLFDIDSGARPTAGTAVAPLDLQSASGVTLVDSAIISFTGSTQTVLLQNIPANTNASGRFFVGVRALESTANITARSTGFSYGSGPDLQLALSGSGGDTAMPGGVSVNANYLLSTLTALGVNVPLQNAVGATVDAQVSVTNGNTALPSISIQ